MQFRLFVIVSLVLSNAIHAASYQSNGFDFDINPTPAWVKPIEVDYQSPAGHDSDYLLVDNQVKTSSANLQAYYKFSTRANNLEALEDESKLEVYFVPAYQQLHWHSIDVIRNGQRIHKLKPAEVKIIQKEDELDNELITGGVTSLVFVPDTRKGDIIEYSYSISGANPIYNNLFSRQFYLNWQSSIKLRHVRVITPANIKLETAIRGIDAKLDTTTGSDGNSYEVTLKDTPTIKYEKEYPPSFEPHGLVEFSQFKSWAEVSHWAEGLYDNADMSHPELQKFIKQLKTLPQKKAISEALYFAQNRIRYVGIELGINSHLPRSPSRSLKNGYGDCKDKAFLLTSLLKEIGVKAYPALVSTEHNGAFIKSLPAPNYFDHVIVLIELPGESIWVDPTRRFQRGSIDSIGYTNYYQALPVGHPSEAPMPMEFSDKRKAVIDINEDYYFAEYEGAGLLTVTSRYRATEADRIRRTIETSGLQRFTDTYLNYYQGRYPGAHTYRPITVTEHPKDDEITLRESYYLPHIAEKTKTADNWKLSAHLHALSDYTDTVSHVNRNWPWELPAGVKVHQRVRFHLPEPVKFKKLAREFDISEPNFSLRLKERSVDSELIADIALELSGNEALPPEELKMYANSMKLISLRQSPSYVIEGESQPGQASAFSELLYSLQDIHLEGAAQ